MINFQILITFNTDSLRVFHYISRILGDSAVESIFISPLAHTRFSKLFHLIKLSSPHTTQEASGLENKQWAEMLSMGLSQRCEMEHVVYPSTLPIG